MPRVNRHDSWTHVHWSEPYKSAWKAAIEPGDAYKPGGVASGLAFRTNWNNERAFGRYQQFLAHSGLRDATHLPDIDNLRAYGAHLSETLAPYSVIANITQLTGALRAMFPKADLRYLSKITSRLIAVVTTVRPIQDRLIDPVTLIKIGTGIMKSIETGAKPNRFAPQQYRDGALVVACANMPLRLGNWRCMIVDENIDLQTGRIKFRAAEMKGRREFEATLSEEALIPLRTFVEKYRPNLLGADAVDQGFLFPSRDGGISHRNALGMSVKASIKRHTGKVFNFHAFRHSAATFVSETNPEVTRMLTGVLHHSGLRTTEKYYIRGAKRRAFKMFQGAVKEVVVRGRRRKAASLQDKSRSSSKSRNTPLQRRRRS